MTEVTRQFQKLIDDFSEVTIKERTGSSFLEITKCAHLENVWSNILAFYINPNNEHHLFDLLLKSIFHSIGKPVVLSNLKKTTVRTEYPTPKGNRIDIVVMAENFILGIENKVSAGLYNDLEDYSNTIESLAKAQNLPAYKIVLSKYKNETTNGFENLVYSDLVRVIRRNLGGFTDYADTKYLVFLVDFLKNIENHIISNKMGDNLEVINFLQSNVDKVNKLLEYHNKFNSEFERKLDHIDRILDRSSIKVTLNGLNRTVSLLGSASNKETGRFTWQGHPLIKYNLKINDVSLFYQVGFSNYRLHSHFWLAESKYQWLENRLKENGIGYTEYEYNETDEEITKRIEGQIKSIINVLDKEL